ncbi:MAG TPA: hydrogen gas-evolving membrane-bound hydrogenase subunit E [Aggregatilineaceae bacterium]|nr:hydrogen gas-evolving membrane-bound hydrogenase subunit E [Aggregatilineaceae bacterium]
MLHVVTSTAPSFLYRGVKAGWLTAALPFALLILFASAISGVVQGQTYTATYPWVPSLGVNLTFRLDALSLVLALLISGIGMLVLIYSSRYLEGDPYLRRFTLILMLFMGSMLGVVLADNIMLLFIFWELTSFSSYLLIGFNHQREAAREAAKQALIVTSAGGLAMLAGLVLLGITTGTWELSEMQSGAVISSRFYLPILLLIAGGACTKSAQFPFHFWLPKAMEAPTPVSAYLHSATMVNAGIYLLARLMPVLGDTREWQAIMLPVGAITLLMGGYLAWQQTDMKLILAYTTISTLGLMVLLLGLGAVDVALLLLLAHALYKGALFMVTGAVDHETGTRDVSRLGGLRQTMPITASAAVLAVLSMAGIPPLVGFVTKEAVYTISLATSIASVPALLLTGIIVLGNVFNAGAGWIVLRPFFGKPRAMYGHEASPRLWIGPFVLGIMGLLGGLSRLAQPLLEQTAFHEAHEIKLWHGFNTAFALSGLTIAASAVLALYASGVSRWVAPLTNAIRKIGPQQLYTQAINGVLTLSAVGSRIVLKAYLRQYIRVILIVFVLALAYVFATDVDFNHLLDRPIPRFYELTLAVVIMVAALSATRINKRLSAAAMLGTVGYGVTLIYVLYGAPDLAMTQFAIETLTVILFVVVVYRLPKLKTLSSRSARRMDAILAAMVGATMTLLTLVVTSVPLTSRLSPFFAEKSYVVAHGHNVVNVILVDFRGFDTMGEITVLSVAAIGVYALLRLNLHRGGTD